MVIPILKFIIEYNDKTNKESYALYLKIKAKQPIPESISPQIRTLVQLFYEIVDNRNLLGNLNNLSKKEKIDVLDKLDKILQIIYATRYEMQYITDLTKKINEYKTFLDITNKEGYEKSHSNEVQKKKRERYEKAHPSSSSPAASQSSKGLNQLFKTN
jgi:hypothetical protein